MWLKINTGVYRESHAYSFILLQWHVHVQHVSTTAALMAGLDACMMHSFIPPWGVGGIPRVMVSGIAQTNVQGHPPIYNPGNTTVKDMSIC